MENRLSVGMTPCGEEIVPPPPCLFPSFFLCLFPFYLLAFSLSTSLPFLFLPPCLFSFYLLAFPFLLSLPFPFLPPCLSPSFFLSHCLFPSSSHCLFPSSSPCLSSDVQVCHQRHSSALDLLLIFLCSLIQTLTLTPPPNNALLANMDMRVSSPLPSSTFLPSLLPSFTFVLSPLLLQLYVVQIMIASLPVRASVA